MKRTITTLFISLLLIIVLPTAVFAATPTASLSATSTTVSANNTVTITVNISNCSSTSLGIVPSYDSNAFELVSGEILVSGAALSDFSDGCAVIAYASAYNFSGKVFQFVLKAKSSITPGNYTIKCEVSAEGYSTTNPSITINAMCTNHQWSGWSQTKAPTCTDKGEESRTCSVCKSKETRSIVAKGHTYGAWSQTKAPTCTDNGTEVRTCSVCKSNDTRSIAANGHTYGAWTQTKAPTCTENGTEVRTCSVCKSIDTRSVAAKGHTYSASTRVKEPTCTEKGLETRACSVCGNKDDHEIAALGHDFGNWTVTVPATLDTPGVETRVCSRDSNHVETREIPATGGTWSDWKTTREADCEHEGEQKRTNSQDSSRIEIRIIPAFGHEYEEKIIRDATLTETGILQKKCKWCGKTSEEVINCKAVDAATGIGVTAEEGTFAAGTTFSVERVNSSGSDYLSVKNSLAEISGKCEAFDITSMLNGTAADPAKAVTLSLPIPEGFSRYTALYLIGENGTATEIETRLSEDGKTMTCEVTSFGRFAFADLSSKPINGQAPDQPTAEAPTSDAPTPDTSKETDPIEKKPFNYVPIIIIAAVVALAIIAGVVILLKKKK